MLYYIISFIIIIGTFIATNYRYENYGLGDIWLWLFLLGGIANVILMIANISQKLNLWQIDRMERQLNERKYS